MQIPRSASALLAALALSTVLVGCGGDDPADVSPEPEFSPPVGGEPVPPPPLTADPSATS